MKDSQSLIAKVVLKLETKETVLGKRGAFGALHHLEIELRKAMKKHDLQMPTKADPRFAVAGG